MVPAYARLKNILHVEGLKANLLSISQLCDQNLVVKFTKERCVVYDEPGQCVLTGSKSLNNCYLLEKLEVCYNASCYITEIWHQKLGHLNFRNLIKITEMKVVKGVPKLTKKEDGVCGPCQLGKQSRASHKVVQDIVTIRVLELLHMDYIGPTQTESLSSKRYVFMCVYNYSSLQNLARNMGFTMNFSALKTPQQNGVVERNNHTLQETQGASSESNKLITQNCELADEELQEEQEIATQVTTPTVTTEIAQDSDRQQVIIDVATKVTIGEIISRSDKEEIDDEEDNEDSSLEPSLRIKKNHLI
ncbi:uncharacterized protein LOC120278571 [Dioscorea cayenensis subsp. rotundata]|uniref:Uncharacterized protein LOC120278571 n=1 Tax=Dioscorea cayennensis subsp. rotundata TaxID=55577 RepID=A0AB40CT56_DIOCR|nr:uncharacterized protein LOC120278571 [Dioscorea cayenensis subsp. rotundata]